MLAVQQIIACKLAQTIEFLQVMVKAHAKLYCLKTGISAFGNRCYIDGSCFLKFYSIWQVVIL